MPIFCQVDRVKLAAQDRDSTSRKGLCEVDRRLASKLDDHRDIIRDLVGSRLMTEHFRYALAVQRLKIEPIRCIEIGRNRLRVRIDHDRRDTGLMERLRSLDSGIVELDALPDPNRAGADDNGPGTA